MKNNLLLLFSFIINVNAYAQLDSLTILMTKGLSAPRKVLNVGDKVPNLKWKMFGNPTPYAKLSDYKGKIVLLDFWSFGCSSCIDFMPQMEEFQKKYKGKIQVLPVTFQSASITKRVYDAQEKNGRSLHRFSIIEDTISYKLFSTYQNPMVVWIGKNAELLAVTDLDYVTDENIQAAIDGKEIDFGNNTAQLLPTFKNGTEIDEGSLITEERRGLYRKQNQLRPSERSKIIAFTGYNFMMLYSHVIKSLFSFEDSLMMSEFNYLKNPGKRIVADKHVPLTLGFKSDSAFRPGSYTPRHQYYESRSFYNRYHYEQVCSLGTSDKEMKKRMLRDLDNFFDINTSVEKRKVRTLSLVELPGFKPLMPKDTDTVKLVNDFYWGGINVEVQNQLKDYVYSLNFEPNNLPIIFDKTNYTGRLDFPFDLLDIKDEDELKRKLNQYNLDIVPEEREIYMIVMSRRN